MKNYLSTLPYSQVKYIPTLFCAKNLVNKQPVKTRSFLLNTNLTTVSATRFLDGPNCCAMTRTHKADRLYTSDSLMTGIDLTAFRPLGCSMVWACSDHSTMPGPAGMSWSSWYERLLVSASSRKYL